MDKTKAGQKMYKEIKVKAINPVYAVGAAWLLYGLVFPLYRLTDLLIAAGVSVIAFIAAKRFIPEKTAVVPLTGKGALDIRCAEIIEKGYDYIEQLKKYNDLIPEKELTRQIDEITAISEQMFDYTAKNPRMATDLRNFIEYYYPTTMKLLGTYVEMRVQSVRSKNINEIMDKIPPVMETVTAAFRKQLNMMYDETQLDIKTDIQVLNNVLLSEGLIDKSNANLS